MPRIVRTLAAATLLLLASVATCGAQSIWWELHGGATSSTITGDVSGSPGDRIGMHLGAGARFSISEAFGMNTEVNYIQRGLSRDEKDDASIAIGAKGMTYKINYFEFNGLMRVGTPSLGGLRPVLLGGVGAGFKKSEKLTVDGGPEAGTKEYKSIDGLDLTMILGVTMDLGEHDGGRWFVDARYAKSLMSVADPLNSVTIETPDYRNRTFSVAIGHAWQVNDF